ncbi:MAG TPA: GNAT family N-acetyltransferase, partial [Thermoplasmatales archaeon]|nr:GNAT family N-acetyltransferase [Thermoplasmatales archaeon]
FIPSRIKRNECFFDFLCLLPQYQKKGIGKKLYEYAEENVQNKINRIFCFVKSSNVAARKLLKKLDFEEKDFRRTIMISRHSSDNIWILMEKYMK